MVLFEQHKICRHSRHSAFVGDAVRGLQVYAGPTGGQTDAGSDAVYRRIDRQLYA